MDSTCDFDQNDTHHDYVSATFFFRVRVRVRAEQPITLPKLLFIKSNTIEIFEKNRIFIL